jgi:hypothetical protein
MTIYPNFKPTFIYIKQHSKTGLLYFGKTSRSSFSFRPDSYLGSGKYWKSHLNTHGKQYVITLWYCLFTDKEELIKFALAFSKQENIVKSSDWANLKPENGLDGSWPVILFSPEMCERRSLKMTEMWKNPEFRNKILKAKMIAAKDPVSRQKISRASKRNSENISRKQKFQELMQSDKVKLKRIENLKISNQSRKNIKRAKEIDQVIASNIDFSLSGWTEKISYIIKSPNVYGWMKQNMPSIFYNVCHFKNPG